MLYETDFWCLYELLVLMNYDSYFCFYFIFSSFCHITMLIRKYTEFDFVIFLILLHSGAASICYVIDNTNNLGWFEIFYYTFKRYAICSWLWMICFSNSWYVLFDWWLLMIWHSWFSNLWCRIDSKLWTLLTVSDVTLLSTPSSWLSILIILIFWHGYW